MSGPSVDLLSVLSSPEHRSHQGRGILCLLHCCIHSLQVLVECANPSCPHTHPPGTLRRQGPSRTAVEAPCTPIGPRGLWFRKEKQLFCRCLQKYLELRNRSGPMLLTFTLGQGPVLSLYKNAILIDLSSRQPYEGGTANGSILGSRTPGPRMVTFFAEAST